MDQAEELRNVIKKQNQRTKKPARIITVTSGKGGVGKSNIAVNLAVQFQRMGLKTIIFDADIGLANVEVMSEIPAPVSTITISAITESFSTDFTR